MSDPLLHAMVGDWLGSALGQLPDKRLNPGFVAAVLAFLAHAWLDGVDQDYTPDWVAWRTDAERFRQDLPYVTEQVTGLAVTLLAVFREKDKQRFQSRVAGLFGAMAPDLIDGVYAYLHPEAWRSGQLLLPWHRSQDSAKGQEMSREQALRRTAYLTLLKLRF